MFLHVTTQIEGRKYDGLLSEKGFGGFPSFAMLDDQGNVIAKHAGARTVDGFAQTASSADAFIDVKKKAMAGDAAAKIDYTLKCAELGQFTREELQKELKTLGRLTPEQKSSFDGVLANLMVDEIMKTAAGKQFEAMLNKGLVPTDRSRKGNFYQQLLGYADYKKDPGLFKKAIDGLREVYGGNPNAERWLKGQEAKLEKMKQK